MTRLIMRTAAGNKDAFTGVVSSLGALAIEISYIVFTILLGIKLFRQGAYYQLFKSAGEEKRTDNQAANVLGTALYLLLAFILLPVVKFIAKKLFGG